MQIKVPYLPITISPSGICISALPTNDNSNISPPPQLISILKYVFLIDVPDADFYLMILCIILLFFCFILLHAFSRPPPVHRKVLFRRPSLKILFKPDDISSTFHHYHASHSKHYSNNSSESKEKVEEDEEGIMTEDDLSSIGATYMSNTGYTVTSTTKSYHSNTTPNTPNNNNTTTRKYAPIITPNDLPDSFAPLLSSSQMEILTDELTCDLLHATHVEGYIRLHKGRQEIPLDKDTSRPQLVLEVPNSTGCKVTAVAAIGSDGMSNQDDLDVSKCTKDRSSPLVKHAGIILDPPLPLVNVAPTLIHFPTLFEDNVVKYTLRRMQIVRYAIDFIKSMSSLIEKMLWILESKCQIHLGKISLTPLYKGEQVNDDNAQQKLEPQWRLSLAFSGHVTLFGWIPIPFVNVVLPTWIIPQPHALLENLLTNQPLASAKLRRERIEEERITLAILNSVESWNFKVEAVATPPALSVDLSMSGGLSVAVETMHGTDVSGGRLRGGVEASVNTFSDLNSLESASVSTLYTDTQQKRLHRRRFPRSNISQYVPKSKLFDANDLVPWKLDLRLQGKLEHDKISISLNKCVASHDPSMMGYDGSMRRSKISLSGHFLICKPDPKLIDASHVQRPQLHRRMSSGENSTLQTNNEKSVASIFLYPEKKSTGLSTISNRRRNLLQYDYEFNIGDDTSLDAVSLSIGASHPMLKGGTIITTVLENIYAYGTIGARKNAVIDMSELSRKRNILRHLPAVDFTAGIQNFFIPEESFSFSDDGQTKCLPELSDGQLMVRVMGGFDDESGTTMPKIPSVPSLSSRNSRENLRNIRQNTLTVSEGIKVLLDFGIPSVVLHNESNVSEFPELDVFDDQKLYSLISGGINGTIGLHLRPQNVDEKSETLLGKNVFNPLERYEIDFSGSKAFAKIVEANATLGHRRIIIPSESTVGVSIVRSVVDMSFEGSTECEFHWDFQGASPILQVTETIGENPQFVSHEERQQVSLLISSLRQGRFNLNVSSVGGLTITQAKTSREHKEGLYDWKFFNAIVSPDEHSFEHMQQVIHDKRTMFKILSVVKLINSDLEKLLNYILKQIWRAKEVFDEEGVSDPGKAIPSYKMARLMSLFLCGNDSQIKEILPLVIRAVNGDGVDVLAMKELIRKNFSLYDEWAPEIDRAVRWVEVMLGSQEAPKPFVETNVAPLSVLPKYESQFVGIPSAKELYATLLDKPHLPLEVHFSGLVSRIAPYLSFRQIEYILQVRSPADWQPNDIRRLRYVYSVKKKVLDISESYGGLSFMPQSFFVSVFLGEATRTSLRARSFSRDDDGVSLYSTPLQQRGKVSSSLTLQTLRERRTTLINISADSNEQVPIDQNLSPAGRIASLGIESSKRVKTPHRKRTTRPGSSQSRVDPEFMQETFAVGDSLLGPQDVAILLQAGLTSSMKGSTVVQLNQRMLLDLMASQPRIFALAVLAEIGTPGGTGNPRGLTSALMALLDLDQSSFTEFHRLDLHQLLESWLPGLTIPRRDDYLAGGRWASQSYYSAMFGVAKNILEEAEVYLAFKGHVQRVRHNTETDPVPTAKEVESNLSNKGGDDTFPPLQYTDNSKLSGAIFHAKEQIIEADNEGYKVLESLQKRSTTTNQSEACLNARQKYKAAFSACAELLKFDKLAFHSEWFKSFYRRNYDALMVKSVYDNVIEDVDDVREWLGRLRRASEKAAAKPKEFQTGLFSLNIPFNDKDEKKENDEDKLFFDNPDRLHEQEIVDEIIDLIFYDKEEQERIRSDPLVRLLISNEPGKYNFTIVSAMGVITEGKKGTELNTALARLKKERNVDVVRADTGTARSFEYNASKIEEAIECAVKMNKPYGLLGYSQGCANGLFCESLLHSGTPSQQNRLTSPNSNLVCRQLLFSAANGSMHGPGMEEKIHRLIVMCEQFFKYQQGYVSKAFTTFVLETLTNVMDSAAFQKFVAGGGGTFLHHGSRAFWREAQHLPHVPTCVLRGVLEEHTTPESLQMISNLLSKQAGSSQHDSQVHVYDAVGRPIYTHNRNSKILKNCEMGGSIQRTHHWSPLSDEVKFVETQRDVENGTFLCAKDRHVFPFVDVNARFGFIKYEKDDDEIMKRHLDRRNTDSSWEPLS